MAAVFLNDPVSLTLSTGWNTVDLSANVPSGATGAIIHFLSTAGAGINVAARHPDSTDELYLLMAASTQQMDFAGVDASRNIEVYVSNNIGVTVHCVGYFDDRAVFFTNAVSKGAITSAWNEYDFTSDIGADPIVGALCTTNSVYVLQHRMDGSSDNITGSGTIAHSFVANVDSTTKKTEAKAGNTSSYVLYAKGYIKSGYVPHLTAIDRSTTTTGSYETISGSAGASGYNLTSYAPTAATDLIALRKSTASYDPYKQSASSRAMNFLVGTTAEKKQSDSAFTIYERGYFTSAALTPYIREMLVDLNGEPVASATGITVFVWEAEPSDVNATPDQILTAQTTNAGGGTDWQLDVGGLSEFDPVWIMAFQGSSTVFTAAKVTPVYE